MSLSPPVTEEGILFRADIALDLASPFQGATSTLIAEIQLLVQALTSREPFMLRLKPRMLLLSEQFWYHQFRAALSATILDYDSTRAKTDSINSRFRQL